MPTDVDTAASLRRSHTPLVLWVVRIGVTLFLVPFFVVGFGLLFGVGLFAEGPGAGGLGFVRLFGLPFVAVPTIMLVVIWTARAKPASQNGEGRAAGTDPTASSPPASVQCAYCGSPRGSMDARCASCGGS